MFKSLPRPGKSTQSRDINVKYILEHSSWMKRTWNLRSDFHQERKQAKETFLVISDALTLFSHKVIFPIDNSIKKFGNIRSKIKIWAAFGYMECCANFSSETNMELEQWVLSRLRVSDVCSFGFLAEKFSRLICRCKVSSTYQFYSMLELGLGHFVILQTHTKFFSKETSNTS